MRFRLLAGLLGAGLAIGALFGLSNPPTPTPVPSDSLVTECVRLVSLLYARGESLEVAKARLSALSPADGLSLVAQVAAHGGVGADSPPTDLPTVLLSLAPRAEPTSPAGAPRLVASGRGAGSAAQTPLPEFPIQGRISQVKGDASLRTAPTLSGAVLKIIPRGSEVTLLGVEQGQAVEGAEDRWYRVRQAESTGYIYFTLIEPVR